MKPRILITGANGQLGREMRRVLTGNVRFDAIYTDVEELDITDAAAVQQFFKDNRPIDFVVNCAAYTAVDRAEEDSALCRKLNVDAVGILAQAAHDNGAKMIQISTDYVFNGKHCTPYTEDDPTCPNSVYGETKLEGEKLLLSIAPESVIIRTAWLYSPHGKNFVKTMITLGHTKPELKVIFDQVGTPTYAFDLADAIMRIIKAPQWMPGIYHFSNEGAISWYDFTKAIHRIAGITTCSVKPCRTADYPTAAARPAYSVLDKAKIKSTFRITIPHWEESLEQCIKRINLNLN